MSDRLTQMFEQQQEFIKLLQEKRGHPEIPLDLKQKESQQFLKSLSHECMHELFESNLLLKNSKRHRATEITEFDRESYMEELSDVLHYFIGILKCSGITAEEIFVVYMRKGQVNIDRVNSGY